MISERIAVIYNTMDVPSRVTMRAIAQRLGIDRSTVSLALANHPRISAAVREQVQKTAVEMGYQRDPMLSALSHYRHAHTEKPVTSELAWINRWSPPEDLRGFREFDRYWQGASEMARSCGYHLEEFRVGEELALSQLDRILQARNIRGILIPPHRKLMSWDGIQWERYSAVRFGYSVANLPVHAVVADQLTAGLLGFEKIRQKGYRRIGLITAAGQQLGSLFPAGFLLGQSRSPELPSLPFLTLEEKDPEQDRRELMAWLEKMKPDAILSSIGRCRKLLEGAGVRVPEDVGLAVTSVWDADADAGIEQNSYELGRIAVENVVSLINHNIRGIPSKPRKASVDVEWVDGASLPGKAVAE